MVQSLNLASFQVQSFDLCSRKVGSMQTTTCFFFFWNQNVIQEILLQKMCKNNRTIWKFIHVSKERESYTFPTLLPEWRYSTASTTDWTPKNLFGSTETCEEDVNQWWILITEVERSYKGCIIRISMRYFRLNYMSICFLNF